MFSNNWLLVILVLFLLINLVSAIMMRRATELLSTEQKALLFTVFGRLRLFTLILLMLVIFGYLYLVQQNPKMIQDISVYYLLVLFILMMAILYSSLRRLQQQQYPAAYIRMYVISNALRNLMLLGMLAYLLLSDIMGSGY